VFQKNHTWMISHVKTYVISVCWKSSIPNFKQIMASVNVIALWTEKSFFYLHILTRLFKFEPRNDKTNIMRLRPAWIQTSLQICVVWLGSTLFAISFSICNRVCMRTAWILISLHRCTGWSGSMLVTNALCWFCHGTAHFI
jgi:hypothetical protein